MQGNGCSTHKVSLEMLLGEDQHSGGGVWLLQLVVDGDKGLQGGSVHHQLIRFALGHYHAPTKLTNSVSGLYSGLGATVTANGWATPVIPLQIGVYQGDPFSVVIFNTVMCTLSDALKPLQSLGYSFSQSRHTVNQLQYADDTCLIGDGPASCQRLLHSVEKWLQWTGMKAKVPKCHSLGIQASSGLLRDVVRPRSHPRGSSHPIHREIPNQVP